MLPAYSVSAYMHADPCSEGVRWQLLSEAKHSSGHKNFAGRGSLENLYGTDSDGIHQFGGGRIGPGHSMLHFDWQEQPLNWLKRPIFQLG